MAAVEAVVRGVVGGVGVRMRAGAREQRFQLEQVVHAIYVVDIGSVACGGNRVRV
jgi:hypothetical protein